LRTQAEDSTTNPQLVMTNYASMAGASVVPEVGTDHPGFSGPSTGITKKVRAN